MELKLIFPYKSGNKNRDDVKNNIFDYWLHSLLLSNGPMIVIICPLQALARFAIRWKIVPYLRSAQKVKSSQNELIHISSERSELFIFLSMWLLWRLSDRKWTKLATLGHFWSDICPECSVRQGGVEGSHHDKRGNVKENRVLRKVVGEIMYHPVFYALFSRY